MREHNYKIAKERTNFEQLFSGAEVERRESEARAKLAEKGNIMVVLNARKMASENAGTEDFEKAVDEMRQKGLHHARGLEVRGGAECDQRP